MIKLADICAKASSNIRQSDLDGKEGTYPIFGAGGLIKTVDFFEQEKPYVAVVKDGAGVGRVMCLPAYSSVISTMQYIIPKAGTNARYLAYAMEFMNLSKYYTGATIPHIYFKDYSSEQLRLRTKEEQNHIATVLKRVDDLASLRKRQFAKLDELVKTRFVEWFGNPDINEKKLPIYKLGELCEIGSSKRVYQQEQTHEGIPFLRVSDLVAKIENQPVIPSLFISQNQFQDLRKRNLVPVSGDILITSRGTIGKCYIVQKEDEFYFQDGMISWLRHFSDLATPLYIAYLFSMSGFQRQIQTLQAGSTVAYLSIAMLNKLNVVLPPLDLQERFAAFVEQVNKLKSAVQHSLENLETLKAALMQTYFG